MLYIYNVLTLIAFPTIWTCATGYLADSNAVHVARSPCKVDCLLGDLRGATASSINHKHPRMCGKSLYFALCFATLTSEWSLGLVSQGSLTEHALEISSVAFLRLLLCEVIYTSFSWLVDVDLGFHSAVSGP